MSKTTTIKKSLSIKRIQNIVKKFAEDNSWKDGPNIDKFDHLHEELIEMSKYLRYKDEKERAKTIKREKEIFMDGIGDLFFGLCRLANQLDVDIESAFNLAEKNIKKKYSGRKSEQKMKT